MRQGADVAPMTPKIPRMFGAKITKRLMNVSRVTAMAMWRGQLKVLLGNIICWIALRTGNSTIGTVSVTAVSTATRTHKIKVSYGSMRL